MDEKEQNKEWLDRLSDRLRKHEEPYVEGSWERFRSQNKQVIQPEGVGAIVYPWRKYAVAGLSAAAAMIIGLIFWWPSGEIPEIGHLTEVEVDLKHVMPDEDIFRMPETEILTMPTPEAPLLTSSTPKAQMITSTTSEENFAVVDRVQLDLSALHTLAHQPKDMSTAPQAAADPTIAPQAVPDPVGVVEIGEVWADFARSASAPTSKVVPTASRWDFSVMLAPNVTTERVNLGGGMTLAYRLNGKISLQTGVSLSQYGVNSQSFFPGTPAHGSGSAAAVDSPVAPPSGGKAPQGTTGAAGKDGEYFAPAYHTRYLNSQTSSLIGMDIPIELKYDVSDRFYTSFGLSLFGVLKENRTNHFVDRINEPLLMDVDNGQHASYSVRTVYVDERASQHPMDGNAYAGFVNFSIGHQTQLSRKLRLSVEPFFKLPIGRLAHEDMNLTNGGIRIVTGF